MDERQGSTRDLRLLLAAWLLNLLGDQLAIYVLMLRAHDGGYSSTAVASILIAGQLPIVVLAGQAGAVADRVDSRRLFLVIPLVQAALACLLVFSRGIAGPVLLLFALGCGTAVLQPAITAIIPEITGDGRSLARAMGSLSVAGTVGNASGALLAGLVVAVANSRTALAVDAATFLVAAVLLAAMATVRRPAPSGSARVSPSAGFRHLFADPALRTVVGILTAAFFVASIVNVVEVFYIKDVLNAGDFGFGVLIAAGIAAMSVGAVLAGRRTTAANAAAMSLWAIPFTGGSFIVAAAVPALPVALAAYVVGGVANGVLVVAGRTLIAARTRDSLRGRAFAALGACVQGAQLVAFAIGGGLGRLYPARLVIGMSGVAVTAIGLAGIVTWTAQERRRLEMESSALVSASAGTGEGSERA